MLDVNTINNRHTESEDLLRDELINNILIVWSIFGLIGFTLTSIRSMELGWIVRDSIYLILLICGLTLVYYRLKIPTNYKASFIVFTHIGVGVIGTYTLGLVAGSIFCFPVVAVIIALFYTKRTVILFVICSLLFMFAVALGFISNTLNVNAKVNFFLRDPLHWTIYISMFAYFLLITSMTILNYRQAIIQLLDYTNSQNNKIEKSNKALDEANKQLKISSNTDFLTKLSNRSFYERRLNENISTAKLNGTYLSLLMIDIDNFKAYNDNYGHDNGDITLRSVAESINSSLQRVTDLASRFGGEEFVVLLPSTDAINAISIAEIIRQNIEKLAIKHAYTNAGIVTVSIGIEVMKAGELNKIDLFKHSDIALYLAKDKGKNCSCLYHE